MKKLLFSSFLMLAAYVSNAQLFVEGVPLDSANHGQYLIVEQSSEVSGHVFLRMETEKRFDKKGLVQLDWLTDKAGKRKPFESRVAALNFLYENGWEVAFVLTNDSLDDNRLMLKRRK